MIVGLKDYPDVDYRMFTKGIACMGRGWVISKRSFLLLLFAAGQSFARGFL
ncbi:MAG: hypothetical protein JWP78_333 [Mucilaginibacter sp.]|nr:hypothetical protein [Mucilaginibacter sp.]